MSAASQSTTGAEGAPDSNPGSSSLSAPPGSHDDALEGTLLTPAERLQRSREKMAAWMLKADGRVLRKRAAAAAGETVAPSWLNKLRDNPVLSLVVDAVSTWWASHPMQPVVSLVDSIGRDALAPVVRRHPRTTVAAAVVVGAVIVWSKPWRWLTKPAILTGIMAQVGSQIVAHLPMESILQAITTFTSPREPDPPIDRFQRSGATGTTTTASPPKPAAFQSQQQSSGQFSDPDAHAARVPGITRKDAATLGAATEASADA